MYLAICDGKWAVGKTETRAKRLCQLIYGKKMKSYLVYETDDDTVEVTPSGHIIREKSSNRLEIIRRVKEGKDITKSKEKETEKKEETKSEQ